MAHGEEAVVGRAGFKIPDLSPDRPKVPDVRRMIQAYYARPGNEVGGNCHVVLDDNNLGRSSLHFCLDRCVAAGDEDGAAIMRAMLQMTGSQRRRVVR